MKRPDPERLLAWYDAERRDLPWRYAPGAAADPYRVWLSEIMLQQTTVAHARPYFLRFVELWPTVEALAAAPVDDVMREWAGLGYYSRARNLHACAQAVARDHGGRFPSDAGSLRELPGVGPYTAAAIAAIAFGKPETVVDGNVERVIARVFAVEDPLPAAKPRLRALAATLTPDDRPGDYAQAMMDLGATICTPRSPACPRCPWGEACAARAAGIEAALPRRSPKRAQPVRRGVAYVLVSRAGNVLLRRRPPKGLLGGMLEIPSSLWEAESPADPQAHAPAPAVWAPSGVRVEHTFTHFHLILDVWTAQAADEDQALGIWVPAAGLSDAGLPTLMRKVAAAGLRDDGPLFRPA